MTKLPVIVLLDDVDHRAIWLGYQAQVMGIAVWWSRNVTDFWKFVEDAMQAKRLICVIAAYDCRGADGKNGFDALDEMMDIGNIPIIIWEPDATTASRMKGIGTFRSELTPRVIPFRPEMKSLLHQNIRSSLIAYEAQQ